MKKQKIAIQGVAGAFHEEAARKFYGDDIDIEECSTFRLLCQKIDNGEVDYGIMAIENTIAGSLLRNYTLIDEYHLRIIGETFLHIQMNLMALSGVSISDIKYIYSHPIALQQCAEFLSTLNNNIKITESDDTAESAKLIAENNLTDTAAIAGIAAAQLYRLNILEKGIETIKKNYTRFIALSKQNVVIENCNKASLSFELRHQPGSLVDALSIFSRNSINLTKIQSVPILGKPYQYTFHVDIEWDSRKNYEVALNQLLKKVACISVYGEYVSNIKSIMY